MINVRTVLCVVSLISWVSAYELPTYDHGVNLQTRRPLVVGHRGFCGAYPDHTSISYEEAIKQGADVIECDICLTKDLVPVCLHEPWLKTTTDVLDHPEFADKMKTLTVGEREIRDEWFSTDFTLAEIKTLGVKQRLSNRDKSYDGQYQITTLEEHIAIAINATRVVGLYPETKHPEWFNSLQIVKNSGRRFEDFVLDILVKYGYTNKRDPCFIQSFDEESLRYMANKTDLPLIMLYSGSTVADSVTSEKLSDLSTFCYGIGPSKNSIVVNVNGRISEVKDLISRAHAFGLKVHPYTFRNEDSYIAWDYLQDPWNEYDRFLSLGVDGYFTDFTPSCVRFLEEKYKVCNEIPSTDPPTGSSMTTRPFYLFILIASCCSLF